MGGIREEHRSTVWIIFAPNNSEITNALIKEIVIKTNLYDVPGVFNLIDIINSLFKEFEKNNSDENFLKFNYVLLNQIDKCIFKVDHSICVAKLFLLYYNCIHLMTALHIGEFIKLILFGKFFNLFFPFARKNGWSKNLLINIALFLIKNFIRL